MNVMALTLHQPAPEFSLPDQTGQIHTLKQYRGRWVLLYFYPKDDTPGCTSEACSLRDEWSEFAKFNAVVLGVSADSSESHHDFAEKYQLPFPLLADPDKNVIKAYDAWGEKKMYVTLYQGILRTSYLIDPDGKIAKIYPKVTPKPHAKEVLRDIRRLSKQ
jgi:thioredoxin-dependent peroxiredoxin